MLGGGGVTIQTGGFYSGGGGLLTWSIYLGDEGRVEKKSMSNKMGLEISRKFRGNFLKFLRKFPLSGDFLQEISLDLGGGTVFVVIQKLWS